MFWYQESERYAMSECLKDWRKYQQVRNAAKRPFGKEEWQSARYVSMSDAEILVSNAGSQLKRGQL
jgi:hypothetical protein